jgi:hypothetical protein
LVVPGGTRAPTKPDFWKAQLRPTWSLGVPETLFKLVVCEIGRAEADARRFAWDAAGDLHKVGGERGEPGARGAGRLTRRPVGGRGLEVAFGVDGDRWLIATVVDLLTRRTLNESPASGTAPVIQFLPITSIRSPSSAA